MRVLAGGQEVTNTELLSRQVMKVTIPAKTIAIVDSTGKVANTNPTYGALPAAPPMPKLGATLLPPQPGPGPNLLPVVLVGNQPLPKAVDKAPPVAAVPAPPEPPYLFVDVQLATPYGVTSHLLIPAFKPAKAPAASGGSGSTSPSTTSAGLGWATDKMDVCFVYKGLGIQQSTDDPAYRPLLAIDLSSLGNLSGATITLSMTLGDGAKGKLNPVSVLLSPDKYDPTAKLLKLQDADVKNLLAAFFAQVKGQFGPSAINPPQPISIAQTDMVIALAGGGQTMTGTFANKLAVNWIQGATAGGSLGGANVAAAPAGP